MSFAPLVSSAVGATSSAAVKSGFEWFAGKAQKSCECSNEFTKVDELKPSQGDLIEFDRDLYDHWGIYIGDGYIIHLVNLNNGKGVFRKEKLSEVAGDCLCRVNNLVEEARRLGLTARKFNEILIAALKMVDKEVEYNVVHNNCEHFATECFYGKAFSLQEGLLESNPFAKVVAQLMCSGSSNSSRTD